MDITTRRCAENFLNGNRKLKEKLFSIQFVDKAFYWKVVGVCQRVRFISMILVEQKTFKKITT